MCKNKLALTLGFFFAAVHSVWVLLIAYMPVQLQAFLNWVFRLHGIEPYWTITFVTLWGAISLIILTFIVGYIIGWVLEGIKECCVCGKQQPVVEKKARRKRKRR